MSVQEWAATGAARGPDQSLALELVRVTEAAAIAAGRWVGRGERGSGRIAATHAMHEHLRSVPMRGTVAIGEEGTPILFRGEDAGLGEGPVCDLALTAGDGALAPLGDVPNSLAAIAVAERGALYDAPPGALVEKLAVGPGCGAVVDITRPIAENLWSIAAVKDIRVSDVVVGVLNRPRHRELVHAIRDAGARVHLLEGGDLAGAIAVARPASTIDVLLGSGGAAEAVIAAAALSCLGGALQVRVRLDGTDKTLHTGDLVRGEDILFCATGVTGSELLRGVRHHAGRITTQSIVVSSRPGTVRIVESEREQRLT
ncbi:fructose-bisphosphatase class II family protein [Amycolatopsis rhabdoformis]|uniref:Fructose-1,6-bisphosphatase n=1 Tax=Amycolatopsis rhabdoformis TaxID=1448059 RepID=A0ABZ1ILE5_9PSEU|nr:fructose-bisphosphatase class II family protein [Amycolatopsis rhabdoformis]WSE34547.1 fructose-bisphosphatase class II family protein [Amycolatopsis rhabdoformis]